MSTFKPKRNIVGFIKYFLSGSKTVGKSSLILVLILSFTYFLLSFFLSQTNFDKLILNLFNAFTSWLAVFTFLLGLVITYKTFIQSQDSYTRSSVMIEHSLSTSYKYNRMRMESVKPYSSYNSKLENVVDHIARKTDENFKTVVDELQSVIGGLSSEIAKIEERLNNLEFKR